MSERVRQVAREKQPPRRELQARAALVQGSAELSRSCAAGEIAESRERARMMRAFREKHPQADGEFVVAIASTGIFCRPTCSARAPLDKNVAFYVSNEAAMFAGYRACKRCRPLEHKARAYQGQRVGETSALVQRVQSMVERAFEGEPLRERHMLAAGIDPSTARRAFVRELGLTVSQYQRARRMGTALASLRTGANVMKAQAAAGFASSSGFRSAAKQLLGGAPSEFALEAPRVGRAKTGPTARDGSEQAGNASGRVCRELFACEWQSPLGMMMIVIVPEVTASDGTTSAAQLVTLDWIDRKGLELELQRVRRAMGARGTPAMIVPREHALLRMACEQLGEYFAGKRIHFDLPLAKLGTPFQQRVWEQLLTIPFATTRSYGEQARAIGDARAVRAVATANGANYRSIVIPCHRVIGSDGSMTGYGGGVERKKWLLGLERGRADSKIAKLRHEDIGGTMLTI